MREVFMKKVHQCFVHYEVFVYGDNNPFNATVRQSKVVVSWLSYGLQFSMTPLLKTMQKCLDLTSNMQIHGQVNKLSHKIRIVLKNSNCHTKDVTIYKEMPMKTIHDKHLMMITIPPFGIWKRVFENIYMYEHTHMSMFLQYCYIFSVWISNEILSQCTNQLFSHLRQVQIQGCYIMLLGPA